MFTFFFCQPFTCIYRHHLSFSSEDTSAGSPSGCTSTAGGGSAINGTCGCGIQCTASCGVSPISPASRFMAVSGSLPVSSGSVRSSGSQYSGGRSGSTPHPLLQVCAIKFNGLMQLCTYVRVYFFRAAFAPIALEVQRLAGIAGAGLLRTSPLPPPPPPPATATGGRTPCCTAASGPAHTQSGSSATPRSRRSN